MNRTFIAIILFVLIFSIIFELTAFDKNLQKDLVDKHSSRENKLEEHEQILEFFKNNKLNLNMTEKEVSHMKDVKRLNNNFIIFIWILIIITGLLVYFNPSLEILTKLWIPLIAVSAIALISLLFPSHLFDLFHKIFFLQGNYIFSYDSFLITLYPAGYFYELFYNIILRTFIATSLLAILGFVLKKHLTKK